MSIAKPSSAEEIGHELLSLLPRLNRIVAREMRTESSDDLTVVQIRVLDRILEEPMTLSELARRRRISLQAASEHVQSLVERGWVVRVPDLNDRRRSLLHVTEEGEQRLTEMREHAARRLPPLIQRLTPYEAEALRQGLVALHRVLADEE